MNKLERNKKYSNKKDSSSRLYLHANRLKIYYPVIKKDILFEVQTPIEFKKIINNDRWYYEKNWNYYCYFTSVFLYII